MPLLRNGKRFSDINSRREIVGLTITSGTGMSSEWGDRAYILATARELYGRAVYSHKTHEKERVI